MEASVVNLRVFAPKYRQALLFAMIEGLIEGKSFYFLDDRDSSEIENELKTADLTDYRWSKNTKNDSAETSYYIERKAEEKSSDGGCCGCCCGQDTN